MQLRKKTNQNNDEADFTDDEICGEVGQPIEVSGEVLSGLLGGLMGRLGQERRIYLFGEIVTETVVSVISQIHALEDKNSEDIFLFINSVGGYVPDCLALIDVMDSSPCDIQTISLGMAASSACLIASNGTPGKRYGGRNAEFMFHEVSSTIQTAKPSTMRYFKKEYNRTAEKVNRIFSNNTGKNIKEIRDMFLTDEMARWMSAIEARKFGIIDRILTHKVRKIVGKKK